MVLGYITGAGLLIAIGQLPNLTGTAALALKSLARDQLTKEQGVQLLLEHLEKARGDEPVASFSSELDTYLNKLKRKRGEEMATYCARAEEDQQKINIGLQNC